MADLKTLVLGRKDAADLDDEHELPHELMTVNMGPSHPAMHGTVRISLTVDGERVATSAALSQSTAPTASCGSPSRPVFVFDAGPRSPSVSAPPNLVRPAHGARRAAATRRLGSDVSEPGT